VLSYIATKYLDEVANIVSIEPHIAIECALDELVSFEKVFETNLNAVKFVRSVII
jgi:hypothetical protein